MCVTLCTIPPHGHSELSAITSTDPCHSAGVQVLHRAQNHLKFQAFPSEHWDKCYKNRALCHGKRSECEPQKNYPLLPLLMAGWDLIKGCSAQSPRLLVSAPLPAPSSIWDRATCIILGIRCEPDWCVPWLPPKIVPRNTQGRMKTIVHQRRALSKQGLGTWPRVNPD